MSNLSTYNSWNEIVVHSIQMVLSSLVSQTFNLFFSNLQVRGRFYEKIIYRKNCVFSQTSVSHFSPTYGCKRSSKHIFSWTPCLYIYCHPLRMGSKSSSQNFCKVLILFSFKINSNIPPRQKKRILHFFLPNHTI